LSRYYNGKIEKSNLEMTFGTLRSDIMEDNSLGAVYDCPHEIFSTLRHVALWDVVPVVPSLCPHIAPWGAVPLHCALGHM
jgi:hypothetical protein